MTPERPSARRLRRIAAVLGGVVAIALLYATLWYVGFQRGQLARVTTAQAQLQADIDRQLALAADNVADEQYALALNRTDWILEQRGDNATAQALAATARAALVTEPAPGTTPTPTPRPTATPLPDLDSALSAELSDPGRRLAQIEQRAEQQAWDQVIHDIVEFQFDFPQYARFQTDSLLFEALIERGVELAETDRVALGINFLEQAAALGPLPQEAADRLVWGRLYLNAVAYFDINWALANGYLEDLCFVAPFFQNSCAQLFEGLVAHGDALAAAGEWCPAADRYGAAQQRNNNNTLNQKLREAREACAAATPTPTPTVTPEASPAADATPTP